MTWIARAGSGDDVDFIQLASTHRAKATAVERLVLFGIAGPPILVKLDRPLEPGDAVQRPPNGVTRRAPE